MSLFMIFYILVNSNSNIINNNSTKPTFTIKNNNLIEFMNYVPKTTIDTIDNFVYQNINSKK